LNKGCRFCNESAPFYKRIIESVQNKNIKLIAAFPGSIEESVRHMNELGLSQMEVKSSPLNNLQVSGTPTLILINQSGEITDFWVGKLPPDKETEVINKLNS
jgi:thioredoxin-related protein